VEIPLFGPIKMRLRMAREVFGHTQEDAAEQIGCGVRTLYNWERGYSIPEDRHLWCAEKYIEKARRIE